MANKEWCTVHTFDDNVEAEACFKYLKTTGIPLLDGFDMQIVENMRQSQKFPWRDQVPCWNVQIESRAQKYMRSYEDVCHVAKDFHAGWELCMCDMLRRLAEFDALKASKRKIFFPNEECKMPVNKV